MTSSSAVPHVRRAFVWVWLPGRTEPVVAGVLEPAAPVVTFAYGRSYLARPDAISLCTPELPLRRGRIDPLQGLRIASCIRDAGPDAWGQRVILARRTGRTAGGSDTAELVQLTYLLESGSDRIGALDFQASGTDYVPRTQTAALAELQEGATALEAGRVLPATLPAPCCEAPPSVEPDPRSSSRTATGNGSRSCPRPPTRPRPSRRKPSGSSSHAESAWTR